MLDGVITGMKRERGGSSRKMVQRTLFLFSSQQSNNEPGMSGDPCDADFYKSDISIKFKAKNDAQLV